MKFLTVTNPIHAAADGSAIACEVVFEGMPAPVPFLAASYDTQPYGVDIWQRCTAGEFGPVAPYVAPEIHEPEAGAYADIRATLTAAERDTLTVRLTSTGSVNRALQGLRDDALAGLPVARSALLAAMLAAGVVTEERAEELAR